MKLNANVLVVSALSQASFGFGAVDDPSDPQFPVHATPSL